MSHKRNTIRPTLECLEGRDAPSATLGAIPGLDTAAVNSDFRMNKVNKASPDLMNLAVAPGYDMANHNELVSNIMKTKHDTNLGSITGLETAAVNGRSNAQVVGALNLTIGRELPPAGTYKGVGNAADQVATISYASTGAPEPGFVMENHNETFVRDGRRRFKSK